MSDPVRDNKNDVEIATDSADNGGFDKLVFNSNDEERKPWSFCGRTIPRSEIVFFSQLFFLLIFIGFLIFKLTVHSDDGQSALWVALLTSSIGLILPNPKP